MMKKSIFNFILLTLCHLGIRAQIAHVNDSLILVELNDTLNYYSFPTIKWNYSQPVSSWFGVELTNDGRVKRIPDFTSNTLNQSEVYSVSKSIEDLDSLERLDFRKVRTDQIDWNAIYKMPLRFLAVEDYNWEDEGDKIVFFKQLDTIIASVYTNTDTVLFPLDIFKIPSVEVIEVASTFIGNMNTVIDAASIDAIQLRKLNIISSLIRGQIPSSIGDLRELVELNIVLNDLDGELPNSIGFLENLKVLSIYGNEINGEIPLGIYELEQLERLDLSSNELEGSISDKVSDLINLISLSLGYNKLTDDIPQGIATLKYLQDLSLPRNSLSGVIPDELGCHQVNGLEGVNLEVNNLMGRIPPCLLDNHKKVHKGVNLILSENSFEEPIDEFNRIGWRRLFIQENRFTFEDFIHIVDSFSGPGEAIIYSPQSIAGEPGNVIAYEGEQVELELSFDDTVTTSIYYWFKDGVPFDTVVGTNELSIDNVLIEDSGLYHAEIINTIAPDLRLSTNIILLDVRIKVDQSEIAEEGILLYPNPVDAMLIIRNFDKMNSDLSLYNPLGQKIMEINSEQVDLSHLSYGIYHVIGIYNGRRIQHKIVKTK